MSSDSTRFADPFALPRSVFRAQPTSRGLLPFLAVLLLAPILIPDAPVHAQPDKRWDQIDYPPINEFTVPDVETFDLDNGIRFFLVPDSELPLINVSVRVRTGGVLDPDDKVGLAEMMGNVIRAGGSATYPADALNTLLEDKAAFIETFGGFTSAGASMGLLKEDLSELLPVLVDVLQNPAFPDDKIELARTQYKSSISRRNDDQAGIAQREFERLIYGPDSPYGRLTEYETIDNITREDLVELHRSAFTGSNMWVGITGDFEPDAMKRMLQEAFGSIPTGQRVNLLMPEIDYEFRPTVNFIDKPDVNQSYILMGHIGGLRSNPDYAALQVMNEVLSGGFSGRLMQVVRTEMGLAYAVFGSYGSGTLYEGQFFTGVMTRSETTSEAIDAILGQIRLLQDEPITDAELQATKDQFLNSLVFKYDSRAKVLAERLTNEYVGLPADAFDQLVEQIKAVSVQDVQRVARAYLRPDAMQILVVGNAAEIGSQLEAYGAVNEIDITIPVPEPVASEPEEAGDAEAGAAWLNRMAEALLPDGAVDGALVSEGEMTVLTPAGPMPLPVITRVDVAASTLQTQLTTPMGEIRLELTPQAGSQSMGGQSMPLPPAQVKAGWDEARRTPYWIAMQAEKPRAEWLGESEGRVRLRVGEGETAVVFHLDPETALPAEAVYQSLDPSTGSTVRTRIVMEDYRTLDGVRTPYRMETFRDGQSAETVVLTAHRVE